MHCGIYRHGLTAAVMGVVRGGGMYGTQHSWDMHVSGLP